MMSHVITEDHVVLMDTLSLQRLWTRSPDQSLLSYHVTVSVVFTAKIIIVLISLNIYKSCPH